MPCVLRKKQKSFGGFTEYYSHDSISTQTPMNFSVFVPEIARFQRVPVVYFLSGLTCTEETFMVKAGAQQHAAKHGLMLVACDTSPRGLDFVGVRESWDLGEGAGFYVNATQAPWSQNFNMYDYVVTELPELIEKEFPATPDKRSIMGHSMGGHGALVIAFRNSDRYSSVSAFAPIAAPTRCPWGRKAFTHFLGLEKSAWEAYDASLLASQAEAKIPCLIDQGDADEFLETQLMPDLVVDACRKSGHPVEFHLRSGYDHSYYFISTFIGEHIAFHAEKLAETIAKKSI